MGRVGGIIQLTINGTVYNAKGAFSYNLGAPMREAVVGHDAVHGFKELPQVPFIEGEITDTNELDLAILLNITGATVGLILANGKKVVLREAHSAGEFSGNTEEGALTARFEGISAEEI